MRELQPYPTPTEIAFFYDETMGANVVPGTPNTRGFPTNWPADTRHRIAREFGQKHGWHFYRMGFELEPGKFELFEEVYKVWRYI